MRIDRASDELDHAPTTTFEAITRDEVTTLFAAALDGDHRARTTLTLLGRYNDTAHRASAALATADCEMAGPAPCDILASIDRTVAMLRRHRLSS